MENSSLTKLLLTILSICLLSAILATFLQEKEITEKLTPMAVLSTPHSIQVFIMNFLYQKIKKEIEIRPEDIDSYLNDYTHRPDSSFDLFYLPRRENYCQANFLFTMLNQDIKEDYIFMDSSNTDKLKKSLNQDFDFLNTVVFRQKDYSKKEIEKLQNMEWSPKIKVFFTRTNLNYNNIIGRTGICLFQMSSKIPGSSLLHRTDLLIDKIKSITSEKNSSKNKNMLNFNEVVPLTYRLYNQLECKTFFEILESKKFKNSMRNRMVFFIKSADHSRNNALDFLEIHKLMKIYKKGALCGLIENKNLIQEYISNQIRYQNGRKFVLRGYLSVLSTKPFLLTFSKGPAILDRFGKYVSFSKAVIESDQVFEYLKETHTLTTDDENNIYSQMRSIALSLGEMVREKCLKDHRFFQNFALDFILDAQKRPILVNWSGSPQFTVIDTKFVNRVLKVTTSLLNKKILNLKKMVQSYRQDINQIYVKKHKSFDFLEDFVMEIDKQIDFDVFKKDLNEWAFNPIKSLKKDELEGFDVLFNEIGDEKTGHKKN